MPQIFDNTKLKSNLKRELISEIARLKIVQKLNLKLHIVLIGDNLSSLKYVGLKQKVGQELGVEVIVHKFTGLEQDIHHQIEGIIETTQLSNSAASNSHSGLIFQLPLPEKFQKYLNLIPQNSDVDLLSPYWPNLLQNGVLWPTVDAIQTCLYEIILPKSINNYAPNILNLNGKTVAVIGQGKLVGFPVLNWLATTSATIISINKDTTNPQLLTTQADIIISGVGVPNLINKHWVKPGAILIDAGTSDVQGSLQGDIDKNNLPDNCILCPSPGGIGPITVLSLFRNLVKLAEIKVSKIKNNSQR